MTDRASLARAFLVFGAFLLIASGQRHLAAGLAQQPDAATVLLVQGDWFVYIGNKPQARVAQGDWYPAKAVIRVQAPAESNSIVLVDRNLKPIVNRRCGDSLNECVRPIVVPEPIVRTSVLERSAGFFRGVYTSLFEGHWRSSLAEIRTSSLDLDDGVVELARDGRVDLGPSLHALPPGEVVVEFWPIDRGGAPGSKAVDKLTIASTPSAGWTVARGIRPGLYELRVVGLNSLQVSGATAWVLVVNPDRAAAARMTYRDAVAIAREWPRDVPQGTIQAFLRACLTQLSTQ
jgi:hypothetical protein